MARESGSYREGYFATIAAGNTAFDAFVTAVNTRLNAASGGQATQANGTITLSVLCEDGASNEYTFKHTTVFDTGTVAAGTALTHCIAMMTALDALGVAAEGASAYTTVLSADITASITMSN
jgi:hypothetical protein